MKMLSRTMLVLLATCCLSLSGCGGTETAPADSDSGTSQAEMDAKGDGSATKEGAAKADGSESK